MELLISLIPAIPLIGFLFLALAGSKVPRKIAGFVGAGTVGLSMILTFIVSFIFIGSLPRIKVWTVILWEWIGAADMHANIAFSLDSLSLVFIFVITFVGFLIHIYSLEFMAKDEGFSRFFAYMNLFVGSM